ncbi:MAG: hypothetical protein Q9190_004793, partial [Brigantiaea leucoxantha]
MARKGYTQLNEGEDGIIYPAFDQIFKPRRTDDVQKMIVTERFERVASLTAGNSQYSILRIYCDNDRRWKLLPDKKGDPDPNSKRPVDDQIWYDPLNLALQIGNDWGCHFTKAWGMTYLGA